METARANISWQDVFWSTLVVTAGWALAWSPSWIERLNIGGDANVRLLLLLGGPIIGAAQWVATSRRFGASAWWILAYGAGWSAGLWCGIHFAFIVPHPLWMGGVGGAIVGALQWFALKQYLERAALWVIASIAISLFGCWLGVVHGSFGYDHGRTEAQAYLIGSATCGLVIGVCSAITLKWLVAKRS